MPEESNGLTQEEQTQIEETQPTDEVEQSQSEKVQEEQQPEETQDNEPDLDSMTDEEYETYISNLYKNKSESSKSDVEKQTDDNVKDTQKQSENNQDGKPSEETQIDYKAFYENIMKPFKANGKEIKPNSPEDIIRLMQMGAGYNKRMEQLKPVKRAAETLRKANIDEQTLNLLIDINNGDKEALKTFLKAKNIDPVDLDMDEVKYNPTNHTVSDQEIEFSDIIRDIQPSISKINEILEKQWDAKSKRHLLENPILLKKLHEEIQFGRFDRIQAEVENQKALGNYSDVSDLEAYSDLVTKDYYSQIEKAKSQANSQSQNKPNSQESEKAKEAQLKERENKLKAAPVKNVTTPKKQKMSDRQLFEMSDEDFMKLNL